MEELYRRAYKLEAELKAKGKEPHGLLREVLIDAMLDGYDNNARRELVETWSLEWYEVRDITEDRLLSEWYDKEQ